MEGRRVLVTGGAGFIGSHLVDRLVADACEVSIVDDLSTGKREWLNPDARFHQADIGSLEMGHILRELRPQVVFHLAAHASVSESVVDPVADARSNVMGSVNLLAGCAEAGIERFVFSSTGGALYGEPVRLPCDEAHPVRPLSPYGASKTAGEAYVHAFASLGGFQATVLRYANVYGPRQDPFGEAGVIAIFAQRMLTGAIPVIFGDGEQERDFVYVADVVDANVRALDGEPGVYNVGTGVGTTVNDVYRYLASATGYPGQARYEGERTGDVRRIFLDASLAKAAIGWEPRMGLEQGMRETVDFFR